VHSYVTSLRWHRWQRDDLFSVTRWVFLNELIHDAHVTGEELVDTGLAQQGAADF